MKRAAVDSNNGGQHNIAGYMGSEDMAQSEEAGEVDHSGDDAEQRWQPRLQARQLRCVVK